MTEGSRWDAAVVVVLIEAVVFLLRMVSHGTAGHQGYSLVGSVMVALEAAPSGPSLGKSLVVQHQLCWVDSILAIQRNIHVLAYLGVQWAYLAKVVLDQAQCQVVVAVHTFEGVTPILDLQKILLVVVLVLEAVQAVLLALLYQDLNSDYRHNRLDSVLD